MVDLVVERRNVGDFVTVNGKRFHRTLRASDGEGEWRAIPAPSPPCRFICGRAET
jgi:hypothetical protein